MDDFMNKYSYWLTGVLGVIALTWLMMNWNTASMAAKLPIMYIVALALHETEELKLPGGFVELVTDMTGLQLEKPGIAKFVLFIFTVYATVIPAIFSSNIWMVMGTMLIGIMELLMHLAAARVNSRNFYSPGMITAICVQFPVSVYGFYYLLSNGMVKGSDWLYAVIFLFVPLFGGQAWIVKSNGTNYKEFVGGAIKSLFTKEGREAVKAKSKNR